MTFKELCKKYYEEALDEGMNEYDAAEYAEMQAQYYLEDQADYEYNRRKEEGLD